MHLRPERAGLLGDAEIDSTFADECAAFLAGRWIDVRDDSERPVPTWAWINVVTHGDVDSVHSLANKSDGPGCGPEGLQTVIARAVLAVCTDDQLPQLQREVLVPIELELMRRPLTPRRIVELVTTALF